MADSFDSFDIPIIDPESYTPTETEIPVDGIYGEQVTETPAPTQELIISDDAKLIAENQVNSLGVIVALVFCIIGVLIGIELLKIWTNTQ